MCPGHRRNGDVADHVARITFGRLHIGVVSIDIVSGNPLHDLSAKKMFADILFKLRRDKFHDWIIGHQLIR